MFCKLMEFIVCTCTCLKCHDLFKPIWAFLGLFPTKSALKIKATLRYRCIWTWMLTHSNFMALEGRCPSTQSTQTGRQVQAVKKPIVGTMCSISSPSCVVICEVGTGENFEWKNAVSLSQNPFQMCQAVSIYLVIYSLQHVSHGVPHGLSANTARNGWKAAAGRAPWSLGTVAEADVGSNLEARKVARVERIGGPSTKNQAESLRQGPLKLMLPVEVKISLCHDGWLKKSFCH